MLWPFLVTGLFLVAPPLRTGRSIDDICLVPEGGYTECKGLRDPSDCAQLTSLFTEGCRTSDGEGGFGSVETCCVEQRSFLCNPGGAHPPALRPYIEQITNLCPVFCQNCPKSTTTTSSSTSTFTTTTTTPSGTTVTTSSTTSKVSSSTTSTSASTTTTVTTLTFSTVTSSTATSTTTTTTALCNGAPDPAICGPQRNLPPDTCTAAGVLSILGASVRGTCPIMCGSCNTTTSTTSSTSTITSLTISTTSSSSTSTLTGNRCNGLLDPPHPCGYLTPGHCVFNITGAAIRAACPSLCNSCIPTTSTSLTTVTSSTTSSTTATQTTVSSTTATDTSSTVTTTTSQTQTTLTGTTTTATLTTHTNTTVTESTSTTTSSTTSKTITSTTVTQVCNGKLDPVECGGIDPMLCTVNVTGLHVYSACPLLCNSCERSTTVTATTSTTSTASTSTMSSATSVSSSTSTMTTSTTTQKRCAGKLDPPECSLFREELCFDVYLNNSIQKDCPLLCGTCTTTTLTTTTTTVTATTTPTTTPTATATSMPTVTATSTATSTPSTTAGTTPTATAASTATTSPTNTVSTTGTSTPSSTAASTQTVTPTTTHETCHGKEDVAFCESLNASACTVTGATVFTVVRQYCPIFCDSCPEEPPTPPPPSTTTSTTTTTTGLCNGQPDPIDCAGKQQEECYNIIIGADLRAACLVLCDLCVTTSSSTTDTTSSATISTSTTTSSLSSTTTTTTKTTATITTTTTTRTSSTTSATTVTTMTTVTATRCNGRPDPVACSTLAEDDCRNPLTSGSTKAKCPVLCRSCNPTPRPSPQPTLTPSADPTPAPTRNPTTHFPTSAPTPKACQGRVDDAICRSFPKALCFAVKDFAETCPVLCGACDPAPVCDGTHCKRCNASTGHCEICRNGKYLLSGQCVDEAACGDAGQIAVQGANDSKYGRACLPVGATCAFGDEPPFCRPPRSIGNCKRSEVRGVGAIVCVECADSTEFLVAGECKARVQCQAGRFTEANGLPVRIAGVAGDLQSCSCQTLLNVTTGEKDNNCNRCDIRLSIATLSVEEASLWTQATDKASRGAYVSYRECTRCRNNKYLYRGSCIEKEDCKPPLARAQKGTSMYNARCEAPYQCVDRVRIGGDRAGGSCRCPRRMDGPGGITLSAYSSVGDVGGVISWDGEQVPGGGDCGGPVPRLRI